MIPDDKDKKLRDIMGRAFVAPEAFGTDPAEVEAMLDAAGGVPLDDQQVERILKKAKGELPIVERKSEEPLWSEEALTEEEQELVALHRSQGDLAPEILEKLKRYREKARSDPEGGSRDG